MLDIKSIKLILIMDALLNEKIELCNNPKIDRNYNVINNLKYGINNKTKKRTKIRN